ncbi:MAG: hypothetical protein LBP72_04955 [Dysgonamonadaceae bacterium]|jgi:hypothetical protein|nr:hypothetical protein [Dysgonamonadaceae bacterium]
MDNVQLRFVFDRLKQANNDTKKGLLQIEARKSGTNVKKLISTGVHLYRNQFSDRNDFTCKNHNNAPAITGKVTRMFRQIEAFALSDKCSCLDNIRNWNWNESEIHSVVEFIRDSLRKRNPSAAIMEHHNVLIRQIQYRGFFRRFTAADPHLSIHSCRSQNKKNSP